MDLLEASADMYESEEFFDGSNCSETSNEEEILEQVERDYSTLAANNPFRNIPNANGTFFPITGVQFGSTNFRTIFVADEIR